MMKTKAQSYLDYAALIALICISLMAMSNYIWGSVRARIYHIKMDLSDPVSGVR